MKKAKIIVIVGPTASGKSELAVTIAKRFGGEIISADSRQIYGGLDIGTGKVPGKWQITINTTNKRPLVSCISKKRKIFVYKGVPHHCIDFVPPRKIYTAADFKKCAEKAIADIAQREKIPILAGGTGFYVDAVINDFSLPEVSPNQALRRHLTEKRPIELFRMLKKLDPLRAKVIDRHNPRRLIRAIEIAKALGRVPPLRQRPRFNALWLGVALPERVLKRRIHDRLYQRMRQGMTAEAKVARRQGLSWKRFYQLGLEYKMLAEYLQGRIGKKEMTTLLEKAIRNYARRQMTWFRKNRKIHWVRNRKEAEKITAQFLSRSFTPE